MFYLIYTISITHVCFIISRALCDNGPRSVSACAGFRTSDWRQSRRLRRRLVVQELYRVQEEYCSIVLLFCPLGGLISARQFGAGLSREAASPGRNCATDARGSGM